LTSSREMCSPSCSLKRFIFPLPEDTEDGTKRRPTIVDVARKAGVSLGTASKAANNQEGVSPKSRAKVAEAIRELNYSPLFAARQLKSGLSRTVSLHLVIPSDGVIHPSTWTFFLPIIQGFVSRAKEEGYRPQLELTSAAELSDFASLQSFVVGHQLTGSAFIVLQSGDYSSIAKLAHMGRRVVTLYSKAHEAVPSICTNNTHESQRVVQWLRRIGHQRVAFVDGLAWHTSSIERRAGYEAGVAGTGYKHIFRGDWTTQSGVAALDHFVSLAEPPSAIFCANDDMAVGVIEASRRLGVRIPEDLSLVGFDDNYLCQLAQPKLSSVRMPLFKMGDEAALLMIRGTTCDGRGTAEHRVFPSRIVVRRSAISHPYEKTGKARAARGAMRHE